MDIQDLLFNPQVSLELKTAVLEYAHEHNLSGYTLILTPTASNDDMNGSQHVSNGGTDFTYRDAAMDDIYGASTLGYYEYFSGYYGGYTGHYYNGDGRHFDAVVIDPPAYAAEKTL